MLEELLKEPIWANFPSAARAYLCAALAYLRAAGFIYLLPLLICTLPQHIWALPWLICCEVKIKLNHPHLELVSGLSLAKV